MRRFSGNRRKRLAFDAPAIVLKRDKTGFEPLLLEALLKAQLQPRPHNIIHTRYSPIDRMVADEPRIQTAGSGATGRAGIWGYQQASARVAS